MKNAENQPLTVHAALQNNKAPDRRKSEEMLVRHLAKANFLQKRGNSVKEFARMRARMGRGKHEKSLTSLEQVVIHGKIQLKKRDFYI